MADSTHPADDVFRFVSVRGVGTPEAQALARRFVTCDIDPQGASLRTATADAVNAGDPITPVLIVEIPKVASDPNPEAAMMRLVQQFRAQSANRMTLDQLEHLYPVALDEVYRWHRDTNVARKMTSIALAQRVDAALGTPVATFVKAASFFAAKLRLWENLVAEYATPTTPMFLYRLQDMIRWFWILERMDAGALPDGQAIYEAMHATVVLPDRTYHSTPIAPGDGDLEPVPDPEPQSHRDDQRHLDNLTHAGAQISHAVAKQDVDDRYERRYCAEPSTTPATVAQPAIASARLLSMKYVATLDDRTHAVLENLRVPKREGVDVDHARERIELETLQVMGKYAGLPHQPVVAVINNRLVQIDRLCHNYPAIDPCAPYKGATLPRGRGLIRPPAYGDLKVIRSTLLKYTTGEIAHVENVLKGEVKVREFNTLKRNEDIFVTDEETTSELEKETQTTDRFELEKEMSSLLKEDLKVAAGVKVTASLGPVSIDSHVDFAYNRQKEESNKTATRSAREMLNRAKSRFVERRRTQRTVTTIVQTEDKNSHTLANNQAGGDNVHGVYYWLDKYYLAKVVNYGKRLMFEFIVPEPAAFYVYSKVHKPETGALKTKPVAPTVPKTPPTILPGGTLATEPLTSYLQINGTNFAILAALYEAQDVEPPPPATTVIAESFKCDGQEWKHEVRRQGGEMQEVTEYPVALASNAIRVPPGYRAERGVVTIAGNAVNTWAADISILLGKIKRHAPDGVDTFYQYGQEFYPMSADPAAAEDDVVPFAIWAASRRFIVANVEILCRRTARKYQLWQLQTFNAIMKAYRDRVTDYDNWQQGQDVAKGVVIAGNNPELNRAIEKEELKKHCVEMMSGQRFESFDAMRSNVPSLMYPEFSINEADAEGRYIQFFEQAFEWEQMTYVFYPYFWGRKPNWLQVKSLDDPDPIFGKFLQAGAARVLVPARPGFEKTVVHYFASNGKIWNGGDPPIPGDPLWISVVDELKEQEGQFAGGEQEGEPWIYKVPTSLVYLADLAAPLPDHSTTYPNDMKAAADADSSRFR